MSAVFFEPWGAPEAAQPGPSILATQSLALADLPARPVHLAWPPIQAVIGERRAARLSERLKYHARAVTSRRSRARFVDLLAQQSVWRPMFEATPGHFYVPLRLFLDRRWDAAHRFDICAQDLAVAARKFGPLAPALAAGQSVVLIERPELSVRLQVNGISCHEGFWALSLHEPQGRALFNLSFGFLGEDRVMVGSVQGLQRADTAAQAAIQTLTKAAHGLRPTALLVQVLQGLCSDWAVQHLSGIDPDHQVKRRRNAARQGFCFDYRALWTDLGGERQGQSNWRLPVVPRRRTMDEVPVRKRAQYRKRYEWLDGLAAEARSRWAA